MRDEAVTIAAGESSIPDAPEPQTAPIAEQPSRSPSVSIALEGRQNPVQAQDSDRDSSSALNNTDASPTCLSSAAQTEQTCGQTDRYQRAHEQVKEQEKQRVEGVIPQFGVTYRHNAEPLTRGQKMDLALHAALDPFAFGSAFLESGYHEAANDLKGFPWGPKGLGERAGVAYLDTFDGNVISSGLFPILFRQDPRYFRLGQGSMKHRILYSISTNFVAKNDSNRKWGFNYSNILGNFAVGELSNLYYPSGNSSAGLAASNAVIQIAEGAGGSLFNEFWPDLSRKLFHRDPTHGLDALQAAGVKKQQTDIPSGVTDIAPGSAKAPTVK